VELKLIVKVGSASVSTRAGERVMNISEVKEEVREVLWLASIVWGLSILGVALAVVLALAMDNWLSWGPAAGGSII
jgi:ligand-binding sensor domain-containing protein